MNECIILIIVEGHSLPLSMYIPLAAGTANASGYSDADYPVLSSSLPALGTMPMLGEVQHTALPPELIAEFDSIL